MKHMRVSKWSATLIALALVLVCGGNAAAQGIAGADVPYQSYTRWPGNTPVYNRAMYEPVGRIDSRTLGLKEPLEGLADLYSDSRGKTYLLSDEQSRLLILDENDQLIREITSVEIDGSEETFEGARGVYVDQKGQIYLSDTENGRVLVLNENGGLLDTLLLPDSKLIPSKFEFRPINVTKDSKGYLYLLSEGSYYGAMLYSPQMKFLGFYGANAVETSVLDAMGKLWYLLTNTTEKRSAEKKKTPYQAVDLCTDSEDFIYTVTGRTEASIGVGQIKRLAPNGTNILYKKDEVDGLVNSRQYNFMEDKVLMRLRVGLTQNMCGIALSDDGYIFGLDSGLGKVYLFDRECNTLSAFGGGNQQGEQLGVFKAACAIATCKDRVLVADGTTNSVTVFQKTAYGALVQQAQELTIRGEYGKAAPIWQQVLAQDANNRLAYVGLAKNAYLQENYSEALQLAKQGQDKTTYDLAFSYVRQEYVQHNFWWLFTLLLLVLVGIAALIIVSTRKKLVLIGNEKVRIALRAVFHPFDSFREVKEHQMGSIGLSVLLTVVFYLITVLNKSYSGFLFQEFDGFNAWFVLAQTVGLVLLWTVANWSTSVLMEGKGKLREIFMVTAYSTIPLIAGTLINLILSNVINYDGMVFVEVVQVLAIIGCGIILCVGTMSVQEFSFPKFVGSAILSTLAMGLIIFILFMLGVLLQQFTSFLITVAMEIIYR